MPRALSGKKLVIVESPTKAKTIRKFLGKDFQVESCMGHVRDLPQSAKDIPEKYKKESWSKLGVNVEKKFDPLYCVLKNKKKIISELKGLLKGASELYLATDEDREGESISWHLLEVLKPKIPVRRMVFHEITKEAIQAALKDTRGIDSNLVRAQEARRILDRLVGYTISPLLWKKVAYGLSAGRVQSVALRLTSERERERISFIKAKYWSLLAHFQKGSTLFEARLFESKGKKVASGKDFDPDTGKLQKDKVGKVLHVTKAVADDVFKSVSKGTWKVESVDEKPVNRKPAPPFITSTLQQEASRKLGLTARETMRVAQSLYERGFITYMRTDSTHLSDQAIKAARSFISKKYGKTYVSEKPRVYSKKKVKGAQEAHEAIRPTGEKVLEPQRTGLKGEASKLYGLIWKRTIASQMSDARQKQVSVKVSNGDFLFQANGLTLEFPGFFKVYVEGSDDPNAALGEKEVHLPPLKKGEILNCKRVEKKEHKTKPPARFTEPSLIQTLEKEGIGRPSTYASIMSTIVDRGYVFKVGTALIPTFTGMVVVKLLRKHFPEYVDLKFTSGMEESLDEIASGDLEWIKYLSSIYFGQKGLKTSVEREEKKIKPDEARSLDLSSLKGLQVRVGRYGAYVCRKDKKTGEEVCASLPETQSPADVTYDFACQLIQQKEKDADSIGKDTETGLPLYILTGRYGPYIQRGNPDKDESIKRVSIPKGIDVSSVDLAMANKLMALPLTLGVHSETKKEIKVGIGRFGPYVVHDRDYRSIPKTMNFFEVSYDDALALLKQPKGRRGKRTPLKVLGSHPQMNDPIEIMEGKFGPYIKCGKVNASLPENLSPEKITKDQAIAILTNKIAVLPLDSSKKSRAKKKTKKKAKKKLKAVELSVTVRKKTKKKARFSKKTTDVLIKRKAR